MRLRFLPNNIYDPAALVVPTLRLPLAVQIQELKYKVKSLIDELLKQKWNL